MAKDDRSKHDLPEGFAAQTIVRLLQQGKRDRLYMRMDDDWRCPRTILKH